MVATLAEAGDCFRGGVSEWKSMSGPFSMTFLSWIP